jgi:(R,R)-butanediol dehydrogenase / meso-butanediol dehydrogenase / diacetyl reductase
VRAVKLLEAHRLELVDIPAPDATPGEVVVSVDGCGICGSDLSSYKIGLFTDSVPGHELAGVIDAVGDGVTGWAVGDEAVIDPKIPCGICDDCRSGASHRCAMALTSGIGFARDGGFAESVAAPAGLLHRLLPGLALEHACLVEPLSVAIHGVDRARLRPGDAAVVVGLGPIGLLTVATLHARGIGPIIGVDPVADRRRLALELGAATAVSELREVRSHVAPAPGVIECSGHAPLLHAAADLVAPGGRLVLVGVPFGETSVLPLMWVTREIEIIGSIASSAVDFAVSLEMLAADPGIARVTTRRVALADVPQVFEELITPASGGKVVVDPRL